MLSNNIPELIQNIKNLDYYYLRDYEVDLLNYVTTLGFNERVGDLHMTIYNTVLLEDPRVKVVLMEYLI